MPFLRDEGPPIPPASIQKFRESLAVEYGWQVVNETGREVLVVRVPKAKPDYLHELAEVAFYVGLDNIRNTKDVLLIGHEKTARLEPQLLRDHIRAQAREDATVVDHLRRSLDRQYGHTFVQSPSNHQHNAFCVRVPKETVAQFAVDDVNAIRHLVASLRARVMDCQYAYVVANHDHERLGRRVLLELIGEAPAVAEAPAPAPEAPAAPAPMAAPASVGFPHASAARTPFPSSAPPAATAAPFAPPAPPVAPPVAPPAAAPAPPPSLFAPPPPLPATPAAPAAPADVTEHEEYTIVSKPKAAPAPPPAAPDAAPLPSLAAPAEADVTAHDEYEIVSKPKSAPAPPPAPVEAPPEDEGEKNVLHADKEYEVFTSKPKPKVDAPAITPPGKAGFQAALGAAGQAPARTKEYEIIGRTSVTSDPSIASRLKLPGTTPAAAPSPFVAPAAPAVVPMQPALPPMFHAPPAPPPPAPAPAPLHAPVAPIPPRVPVTPTLPAADNGAAIVARMSPAAPELVLAQRFKEAGYEVVEGLRAQGTVFAFAAHRPNGRRVLVKRAASFAAEEAASLAQLVAALGADVALVVADEVRPGTRLATWGTRIEVVTPGDVAGMSF